MELSPSNRPQSATLPHPVGTTLLIHRCGEALITHTKMISLSTWEIPHLNILPWLINKNFSMMYLWLHQTWYLNDEIASCIILKLSQNIPLFCCRRLLAPSRSSWRLSGLPIECHHNRMDRRRVVTRPGNVNISCLASRPQRSAQRGKCILPIFRHFLPVVFPISRHLLFSPVFGHFFSPGLDTFCFLLFLDNFHFLLFLDTFHHGVHRNTFGTKIYPQGHRTALLDV